MAAVAVGASAPARRHHVGLAPGRYRRLSRGDRVVPAGPGITDCSGDAASGALAVGTGRFAFRHLTDKVGSGRHVHLTRRPTAQGRGLVRKHHHPVTIRIAVAYTPIGGKVRVHTTGVISDPGLIGAAV